MSWVNVGAAAVSAGAGIYASNKAGDAQAKGGKNAIAEQQRQYNIGVNMLEPTRALGYGATSDLASMYGYRLPQYTPVNALMGGAGGGGGGASNWTLGGPINVKARKARPGWSSARRSTRLRVQTCGAAASSTRWRER
jgi:hypothetical protein